jgi:hypothetical protein
LLTHPGRQAEAQLDYMVIEKFREGAKDKVYARYETRGRMLPDGLEYIDSWLSRDGSRCFQLMKTEHAELFRIWIEKWNDLIDFEVVPVMPSPTNMPDKRRQP